MLDIESNKPISIIDALKSRNKFYPYLFLNMFTKQTKIEIQKRFPSGFDGTGNSLIRREMVIVCREVLKKCRDSDTAKLVILIIKF